MTTTITPAPEIESTPPPRRGGLALRTIVLVAGLLTVVFAGLLPLAPVTVNDPTVQWPSEVSAPRSTSLALGAYKPLGLDVRFSCDAARAAGGSGVVVSTMDPGVPAADERGLTVRTRGDRLLIRATGTTLLDTPLSAGDCAYRVRGDEHGLAVLLDGVEVSHGGALPDVHSLATTITALDGATAEDLSVSLRVDDQFTTSPSTAKIVLMVLLALSALVAVVGLVRMDVRIPLPHTRFRPRLVDIVVPAVMVLWVFLAPMSDDDGYYSAMARNVDVTGYVGNYYQLLNQGFTPFAWFYYFLSKWQVLFGTAPVVLRIPALLFGLVTWFAVRWFVAQARVIPAEWSRRSPWVDRGARFVLASAFLVWWLPLDMGVRPEGVVTMCGALTLLAVAKAVESQRLAPLAAGIGVAGVGFFAHPTGFTVLAPLLAGLPFLVPLLRKDDANWKTVLARTLGVLSPGAVAVVFAFADGTLRDFVHAQEIFLRIAGQDSWYSEIARYTFLLNASDPMANYAKRAPVLLCLVALVWFVVLVTSARARRVPVPSRLSLAGWSTLFAFLLLWFTPSKWTHHFGSFSGIGSAFLALLLVGSVPLVRELTRDRRMSAPIVLGAVVSVSAMMALAFHGANKWPYSWLLGIPNPNDSPGVSVIRFDKPYWGVIAIAVVAFLVARKLPHWRKLSVVVAIPVVVVLFFLANITYLVGGFSYATVQTMGTWSPWAANVRDPLATDCGAAEAIDVLDVRGAQPLTELAGQPQVDESAFARGRGWFPSAPPPDGGASATTWGSMIDRPGQEFPEQTVGKLTTPWFVLDGGPDATAVLVAGLLGRGNTLAAEFGTTAGKVLATTPISDQQDSVLWRNLVLPPAPSGAETVRLVAADGSMDWGGWLAVTAPSVQRAVPLKDYLPRDAAVAVAWQFAFLFPCQRQPELRDGIIEPISYAVQWGDTATGGISDATWQPVRGGLFGDVLVSQSITALTARMHDFPGAFPTQVYQTEARYPAGQYTLTHQRKTLFGWEAMP
ncbi:arabinosyltransferase domain-containing protein [Umezawaea endophytica]|uniref:Arabinosyltransferase domain-containing protein n=1 Tax=Umezawaea endophytica TaxID=1654476 RepID=A0A9X3AJM2_9PSEU|nr:arabinosyltransferase domain-containing protein [Umezawaea endophytica]MCS7484787.1 arabinosyltransferase domain-containing protein [Umezawaea endophytica]